MFIQLVITDDGQYQNGIDEIINVNLNQPVKIANELEVNYGTPILPLNNAGDLDINELTFKFLDYDGDTYPIGKITKFYMVLTITDDLDLL